VSVHVGNVKNNDPGPGEPGLTGLRLQQTKTAKEDNNQQTERDAEPAKYSYCDLHQKAWPRLMYTWIGESALRLCSGVAKSSRSGPNAV
jgi:hypothetical protein